MRTRSNAATNRALAGLVLGLMGTVPGRAAVIHVPADQPTLQAAVNAAVPGDDIQVAPGVYTEQVVIQNKNLTLSGSPGAVIRAWPGMTKSSRYGWYNLVEVTHATVTIQGLEFEGERLAESLLPSYGFAAVYYGAANGMVADCAIHGFRGVNTLDSITGVGFVHWNPLSLGGGATVVGIRHNTFADNALSVWLTGDWMTNPSVLRTTFSVEDNTITGVGPTSLGAERGILIGCGAGGTIKGNRIADHDHTGAGVYGEAVGILAYDMHGFDNNGQATARLQPIVVEENTLVNNQQGIGAALADGSSFLHNTIEGAGGGASYAGLLVSGNRIEVRANQFTDLHRGLVLVGEDPGFGTAFGIASNVVATGNRFCEVATPVQREPLTENISESGTLTCPFQPPALGIANAVLLSWPDDGETHVLESAPDPTGPWTVLNAGRVVQEGQVNTAVKTGSGHSQYFRLR